MFFRLDEIQDPPEQYQNATPVIVSATTTATDLIPVNANRIGLGLINQTSAAIYLNTGEAATAPASASAKFFVIPPQTYVSFEGKLETPTEAINGVWSEATTGNLTVIERVIV